jgi:transcriptional regulator with PAS, ATPase and Fis domain
MVDVPGLEADAPELPPLWPALLAVVDEALFLATADGRLLALSPRAAGLLDRDGAAPSGLTLTECFEGWSGSPLAGQPARLVGRGASSVPGCLWAAPVGEGRAAAWLLRFTAGLPGLAEFATDEVVEFHGMLSREPHMHQQFAIIRQVAGTDSTVLVRGESGTGKELVARALHLASGRRAGPFLAINCAALTPSLLESELFGHVRGAFTGATRDHPGVFARAHRGTLFLDEVAELPLDLQAKLLRALETQSFTPVGGRELVHVDVRIIAATHRSLRELVRQGAFREDLMYRLRVVPIFLPPLRERRRDIPLLLRHFIEGHNRQGRRRIEQIPGPVMRRLLDHPWPGNVRELANVVEYAFAVGSSTSLRLQDLPPEFREGVPAALAPPAPAGRPGRGARASIDVAELGAALQASDGRVGEAARRLGLSRTAFWRLRRRLVAGP